MRKFNIKVNGKAYEVEVEEVGAGTAFSAPVQSAPVSAPATTPTPAPAAAPTAAVTDAAPSGSTEISAPMPGTLLSVAVSKGDTVKEGDVLCVLEAMKMENEIKSTASGTVVAVGVAKGATVNSGDLIAAIG